MALVDKANLIENPQVLARLLAAALVAEAWTKWQARTIPIDTDSEKFAAAVLNSPNGTAIFVVPVAVELGMTETTADAQITSGVAANWDHFAAAWVETRAGA